MKKSYPLFAALFVCLCAVSAWAQTVSGTLAGVIQDAQGAPIANASGLVNVCDCHVPHRLAVQHLERYADAQRRLEQPHQRRSEYDHSPARRVSHAVACERFEPQRARCEFRRYARDSRLCQRFGQFHRAYADWHARTQHRTRRSLFRRELRLAQGFHHHRTHSLTVPRRGFQFVQHGQLRHLRQQPRQSGVRHGDVDVWATLGAVGVASHVLTTC
jgi:hypothetical protein